MTFEQLVPNQGGWIEFHLNFNQENDRVTTDPALNNFESQSGWTYVYVVAGIVMYIGNTRSKKLSTRIGPELNKSVDDILNTILASKLAYTNIRISRQLKHSLVIEQDVVLHAYNKIDCDSNYDDNSLQVPDFQFIFNMDFLLRWSPRSVQGRGLHGNEHLPFPIERALILKNIQTDGCLPPWNLGLG